MKKFAVRNIRLCTKDCLCLYVCPTGATDTENSIIDIDKCTGCGDCAAACPSGAISLVPYDYPPQQKKSERVCSAVMNLAKNKAAEERTAENIASETDDKNLAPLMKAVARSSRLVSEDLLREGGYMLPQSSISQDLLSSLLENHSDSFPIESAEKILESIKCNDRVEKGGKFRCSVCFHEFELEDGDEHICPMCHSSKDKLERL